MEEWKNRMAGGREKEKNDAACPVDQAATPGSGKLKQPQVLLTDTTDGSQKGQFSLKLETSWWPACPQARNGEMLIQGLR